MDKSDALLAFGALSQPTRLDVLRLLIGAGRDGIPAGEIATALDVRQNTMSANLSVLVAAGLIRNVREGRTIRYFADLDALVGLIGYLMEDCCGGRPDLCRPILAELCCGARSG